MRILGFPMKWDHRWVTDDDDFFRDSKAKTIYLIQNKPGRGEYSRPMPVYDVQFNCFISKYNYLSRAVVI